ncbi:MAG: DUF4340 domain-containing protein [Bacteroidota bacterium]
MTKTGQKKKKTLIFIFTAIATLLVAVLSYSFASYSFSKKEIGIDKQFEIVEITLISQQNNQKISLKKENTEKWHLNQQHRADESAVEELIQTLFKIEIKQPVKVADQQIINQKLENEGVKTSVYIKSYLINLGNLKLLPYKRKYQTLLAGDNTDNNTGTYMKKPSSGKSYQVYIPGIERGISSIFNTSINLWKNPVIIDLEKEEIESVSLEFFSKPEESYILKRNENDSFTFLSAVEPQKEIEIDADTSKVERFLRSFENIRYESLLDDAKEKERMELMIKEPWIKLSVTKTDGTSQQFTIFERKNLDKKLFELGGITTDPDQFYIQMENGDFVLAEFYIFNRIFRPLSFFQNN